MEENPHSCGTAGALSPGQRNDTSQENEPLLGVAGLFLGEEEELPRLGIPNRESLLVHQWYRMQGGGEEELGAKNGPLSEV